MTARSRSARVAAMSFAAVALAACEGPPIEELSFEPLSGEWIACQNDGAADSSRHLLFYPDSFSSTTRRYGTTNGTCAGAETGVSHEIWRYRLTGDLTAQVGAAGRDVVAKQMDIEDSFRTVYTIVYVDQEATPPVLYFGDLALDSLQDGTTPEKRPHVLSASTALTSR
jgi:hypothetical protein